MSKKISFFVLLIIIVVNATNIIAGELTLVFPNGGNDGIDRHQNSTQIISWFEDEVTDDTLDIYLWEARNNTYDTLAVNIHDSVGYYLWQIPASQPISDKYKIKIKTKKGGIWISNNYFEILPETQLPVVSVNDKPQRETSFELYPNPAFEELNLIWESKIERVDILNSKSEIIQSLSVENINTIKIPLTKYGNGIYFVVLKGKNGEIFFEKFIIQK